MTHDKGRWLRVTRTLANVTIQDFCKKYNFGYTTIQAWEAGRVDISSKAAQRLILAFKEENIYVTESWLRFGDLPFPMLLGLHDNAINLEKNEPSINNEINTFLQNKDSVVANVQDDEMAPFFNKNDVVGGIVTNKQSVYSNKLCIIISNDGYKSVRKVAESKEKNTVILLPLNPLSAVVENPVEVHAKNVRIAPIIWHRKIHI